VHYAPYRRCFKSVPLSATRNGRTSTLNPPLVNAGSLVDIKFIRDLKVKGYVKVQTVQALPDGTQKIETFLRVTPVGDSAELHRSVLAPQHNP